MNDEPSIDGRAEATRGFSLIGQYGGRETQNARENEASKARSSFVGLKDEAAQVGLSSYRDLSKRNAADKNARGPDQLLAKNSVERATKSKRVSTETIAQNPQAGPL